MALRDGRDAADARRNATADGEVRNCSTVLDAKLDAAVYQILAKVDQRIDRMPKCHYAASPSSVEQAWDTPDTGEKRGFVLKLQPLE
jgi:hypothetical protein